VREQSVVAVEIADLNFDGNADVVAGLASTGAPGDVDFLGVLTGLGDGTFSALADYPLAVGTGAFPAGVAVGDLNLDHRPDLALSVEGLWTLLNTMGPLTPTGPTVTVVPVDATTGDTPVTVTFTDVTADGQTTLQSFGTEPRQLLLETTATFATAEVCFPYAAPTAPTVILYDAFASAWLPPMQRDTGSAACVDVVNPLPNNPWALAYSSGPATPVGQNIMVNPIDPTTGTTPVTVTYGNVTVAGETTVTSSSTGPAIPSGFELGSAYFELSRTAQFDANPGAEVCFQIVPPSAPTIVHWTGNPPVASTPPTYYKDVAGPAGAFVPAGQGSFACAVVTSFSPFALVLPVAGEDMTAPTVTCGSADGAWHADNVSIDCTALDDGSGLADPNDAAFTLSTSVAAGEEDGDASTDSRQVCDAAGNCAGAGPIAGNRIDREAPVLSLPAGMTVDATSPAGAVVSFSATASDGVDANPGVSCAPASGSTLAIGTTTVDCTATDHVGNTAGDSFTVTVLGAKEQLLALIGEVVDATRLPAAIKTQLIGRLQALVAGFDPANAQQRRAVCSALQVFRTAVQLLSGRGIPAAQATEWIADANRIRAVLGC
jgi:hypothetical protein